MSQSWTLVLTVAGAVLILVLMFWGIYILGQDAARGRACRDPRIHAYIYAGYPVEEAEEMAYLECP